MIPKIIHYCWFGRGDMPQLARDCIASWRRFMPDWDYKLWNEDNFDVYSIPYVKEAYEAKKYAFVSDYVRLFALMTEGGVYMDTDVEVLKSYEPLLTLTGFTGYEGSKTHPPVTGTMASEAGLLWVRNQISEYDGLHFVLDDGRFDLTTNTQRITTQMCKKGFVPDGRYQVFEGMHIFPTEYFCPKQTTGELLITKDTYCNHHFMGTWNDRKKQLPFLLRLFGPQLSVFLIKVKRKLFG